jgi:hypothetical protein
MRNLILLSMASVLAAIITLAALAEAGGGNEPKAGAAAGNQLVGTWKLVSAKYGGKQQVIREGATQIKHVTPTHFIWVIYDSDGNIESALGGPCTRKGEKYEETPEYGVGNVLPAFKGKPQSFVWKVEGNKWHHSGTLTIGLAIEEVWERMEMK